MASVMTAEPRFTWLRASRSDLKLISLCALAYFLDLSGLAVGNTFSAVFFTAGGAFDSAGLGALLGSAFAGAALGVPLLGWLAARRGCRFAMVVAASILALSSLAEAASPDITTLTLFRFVSGSALGALPPLLFAYLANKIPSGRRGAAAMSVSVIGLAAVPATVFLVRWLTSVQPMGIDGWRWTLALNALGATACASLFYFVHEPPEVGEESTVFAGRAPALFHDRANRRSLIILLLLSLLTPWAILGFPLTGGAVLVAKGFDVANSLLYLGVSFLGPIIGNSVVAALADRFARKSILVACVLAMAFLGPLFAVLSDLLALMAVGTLFTTAAAIYVPLFLLYAAETFPAVNRAQANALGWALNRGTAAVVPLVFVPLLKGGRLAEMFAAMSLTLLAIGGILITRSRMAGEPTVPGYKFQDRDRGLIPANKSD